MTSTLLYITLQIFKHLSYIFIASIFSMLAIFHAFKYASFQCPRLFFVFLERSQVQN